METAILATEDQGGRRHFRCSEYLPSGIVRVDEVLPVFAETTGGTDGESATGQGVGEGGIDPGLFKEGGSPYRHPARFLAEVIGLGIDQTQVGQAKVHHHPADRADIEGTLRLDEDDGDIGQR